MGQEQPTVSVDGVAVKEQAGAKRRLSDQLQHAAHSIAMIGVMLTLRNPGSLAAQAKEWTMQISSIGTQLTAGLLAKSAQTDDAAVDDHFRPAESQGVLRLDGVEAHRPA